MAITIDDFSKIWASTSPLTPYEFSENNYKQGWDFVGATPPSRQMWDFLQKNNDEKSQFLLNNFNNYLPLSGGTMTGAIEGNPLTLTADDGNGNSADLVLNADGSATLDGNNVITSAGGTFTGTVNGVTPPNGDNSKKLANTEFIQALASILVPVGCVQAYAGNTVPDGWLLCDGSAVSRTDYADLYAVIGDTYGDGDGSSTFNLPNLIDKFVQGNATAGTVKTAGLPNIEGTLRIAPDGSNVSAVNEATGAFVASGGANIYQYTRTSTMLSSKKYAISFNASLSSSIYGGSTTVQPPALTMQYIIKY